jgi:hypothetical protein
MPFFPAPLSATPKRCDLRNLFTDLRIVILNSFVAVKNLPRLQCALTRGDASGFKRYKASVRYPGPKIDEVIFLVSFRHLIGNRCAAVSIQKVAKASDCRQVAIAAVERLFTTIHKPELRTEIGSPAQADRSLLDTSVSLCPLSRASLLATADEVLGGWSNGTRPYNRAISSWNGPTELSLTAKSVTQFCGLRLRLDFLMTTCSRNFGAQN